MSFGDCFASLAMTGLAMTGFVTARPQGRGSLEIATLRSQ